VFYVDKPGYLKASTYNPDPHAEAAWEADEALGELGSMGVHRGGKISACFTEDGLLVFFPSPGGSVECIEQKGGKWSPRGPLPPSIPIDSPHYPLVVDDKLHFFYVSKHGSLDYLTREVGGDSWQGNIRLS